MITYYVCILVGLLYPFYASYKAIETINADDDKQWLTYWTVYSALTTVEGTIGLVQWLPFYFEVKLLFILWLIHPKTHGARSLYTHQVRPFLIKHASRIDPVFQATDLAMNNEIAGRMAALVDQYGPRGVSAILDTLNTSSATSNIVDIAKNDPLKAGQSLTSAFELAFQSSNLFGKDK